MADLGKHSEHESYSEAYLVSTMEINLPRIQKNDPELRGMMATHYSAPKGFVGRQLIYRVEAGGKVYGAIAAGSATKFLPGRDAFFGCHIPLNNMVNNTFFHIEKQDGRYPCRNFAAQIVKTWRTIVIADWFSTYGDVVLGWETLVELPRIGALYSQDGWAMVGTTKGFTCKRIAGRGTDTWTGKRVWDKNNLRPKRVFCREVWK